MKKIKILFVAASFSFIASLMGCAAATKTQLINISAKKNTTDSAIKSVKCALQQSGWNITYTDTNVVSAAKPYGWDHVPVTLNVSLKKIENNTIHAKFTINNPRGIFGKGDYYTKDVINALQNCGAKGLVIGATELGKIAVQLI